jgi:outer membrane protein assembly factor BamE (lipoprotein component of BamABCDE complex)
MRTRTRRSFCVALLLFFASCLAVMWHASDDTTYAPGYSESKFRSIQVGMSRDEVTRILGKPLTIEPASVYTLWVYASSDYRNPRRQGNGPATPPPETVFQADTLGKIVSVTGGYLDVKEDDYLGHPLVEVKSDSAGRPRAVAAAGERGADTIVLKEWRHLSRFSGERLLAVPNALGHFSHGARALRNLVFDLDVGRKSPLLLLHEL